jgi:arabinofuranosyltransferase
MLNRLDMVIVYLPPVGWLVIHQWRAVRWRQVVAGFLPLAAWLAFSLFYYGFLFPNTKYAKLNTGIPEILYWQQGWYYLCDFWLKQRLASLILLFGLGVGGWCGRRYFHDRDAMSKEGILFSVTLGVLAYVLYVVCVGGDFMSGRFFTLPIFMAVWVCYAMAPERLPLVLGLYLALVLCTLQALWHKPVKIWHRHGIADERQFYQSGNILVETDYTLRTAPEYRWVEEGKERRDNTPDKPVIMGNIGISDYYAGPEVKIIDKYGLADPLLARLPIPDPDKWRIGHFERAIPKGYQHAVKTGSTKNMNPDLAQYYEKLHLITSGDLWDWERIETIVAFNLGMYDHWRDAYIKESLK